MSRDCDYSSLLLCDRHDLSHTSSYSFIFLRRPLLLNKTSSQLYSTTVQPRGVASRMQSWRKIIVLWCLIYTAADAHVLYYVTDGNEYIKSKKFKSVAYFRFQDTKWGQVDEWLNGNLVLYENQTTTHTTDMWHPTFLLTNLSSFIDNNSSISADLVILIVDGNWKDRFHFWWSHKLPSIKTEECYKEYVNCHFLAVTENTGKSKSGQLQFCVYPKQSTNSLHICL